MEERQKKCNHKEEIMWTRSVSLVLFPTHLIALCNNRSTRHNVLPACLPVPVSMSRQDNLGAVKNSHQMLSHSIREVIDTIVDM